LENRIKAKVSLRDLANFEGKWSYKALRVLCFTPPAPGFLKEDLEQAIKDLKSHDLITSIDFLKCLDLEIAVSEGFDIESAITEAKVHLDNPVSPEDLGFWLIRRSRPTDALNVVTEQIALENTTGFFARLQGMLETNRTSEAKKLLNQYRINLSDADELRAQTYWSISIGKKNPLSDYLIGAKSINSAGSLLDVARLALFSNQLELAVDAFEKAWEIDPDTFGLDQANQYLQISLAMRNTKQAHDITKNLHVRFPYKFGNANNLCYLSLLLGEDPQSMEKEAERIIRSFPQNPSFLSTLALAKTLNGKYQEAYDTMSLRGNQRLIHGERALMAVILQNIDKQEDAQKISTSLEEQRMLPEEWAMLKKHKLIKPKG
jgi:tetratricopeptide (TPR) repeat protein